MGASLQGKIALVTGAGGGIGSVISRRLAGAGAQVVMTYRSSKEKTDALAALLEGHNHLVAHCPVDDSAAQARLAEIVAEKYGTLDILVNNAGMTRAVLHDDLDGLDDELIDEIFRTNWRGAFASIPL